MSEEKEDNNIQDPSDKYRGKMDEILEGAREREKDLNIYQRIHKVMLDVWYIKKEGSTGQYDTVEHDDVTRKIRPALVKHGIVAKIEKLERDEPRIIPIEKYNSQTNENYEETHILVSSSIVIRFINIDDPEDYMDAPTFGMSMEKYTGVLTIPGKVLSYAVKMAILKSFALETGVREDTDTLSKEQTDLNAVWMYNELGQELFGDEWEEMGKKKIYKVTSGMTSEASRAPTPMLNEAIKNLYALKKKKEENPDKDINEVNEEHEKDNNDNDITSDFQD